MPEPEKNTLKPVTASDGTVFSPSPEPGRTLPRRRMEDVKSYVGEWTVLLLALLGWASTFCVDAAQNETWAQVTNPKFIMLHIGQLFSVVTAVVAAKRLR